MPEQPLKLTTVRGIECPDGRTCPVVKQTNRGTLMIVGGRVTDPGALAQLAIGPGETAVEIPLSLIPEVAADGA
jgi:hypothetical protein